MKARHFYVVAVLKLGNIALKINRVFETSIFVFYNNLLPLFLRTKKNAYLLTTSWNQADLEN